MMMNSTRKRISIHDYPEHLNPFSECSATIEDTKQRILADRHRKNNGIGTGTGTWSSKISKRVSRSVTWIEKSWPGADESKKSRDRNNRIKSDNDCHDDVFENTTDENTRTTSFSAAQVNPNAERIGGSSEHGRIREQRVHPNKISSMDGSQTKLPEVKKRKKRPAPPPPSPNISHDDERTLSIKGISSESLCTPKTGEENETLESASNVSVIDDFNESTDVDEENKLSVHHTNDDNSLNVIDDETRGVEPKCSDEESSKILTSTEVDLDVSPTERDEVSSTIEKEEISQVENSLNKLDIDEDASSKVDEVQKLDAKNEIPCEADETSPSSVIEESDKLNNNQPPSPEVSQRRNSKLDENTNISCCIKVNEDTKKVNYNGNAHIQV